MTRDYHRLVKGAIYAFEYTNHRGVTEQRTVRYDSSDFGKQLPYHMTPTMFFHGLCLDRQAPRSFDVMRINHATFRQKT